LHNDSISTTGGTPFWLKVVRQGGWAQPVMGFNFVRWLDREDATA